MPELTPDDFSDWFETLWGYPPFSWQRDLTARLLESDDQKWPDVIALPTAAGKTACVDIAVFILGALAQAEASKVSQLARRVFFVVDRRIIVDAAFERARRLATSLREARGGIVLQVADGLRRLAGSGTLPGENEPLKVHQLRGGLYRSDQWARSPLQPTVVCTTVDQIGSRLLFRGYGASWNAWPIHAGLIANESLILLDEAHCSQPFLQTVRAVQRYRTWAKEPVGGDLQFTVMSATPPDGGLDVFRDTSTEPRDPEHPLGRRQLARKPAELRVASGAKGRDRRRATEQLAKELVKRAEDVGAAPPKAVVVFCNRVATAREVFRRLRQKHGECATLLTGRMRPLDKDDLVIGVLRTVNSEHAANRELSATRFVVCTQALEVGADLDFDALVSECASLDALRQRFGRLNRMGRMIDARGVIVIRADQVASSDDDLVYGSALASTWNWLNSLANPDFGVAAMDATMPDGEELAKLTAPAARAPVMLPAYVDRWSQTFPEPVPTPDVSTFLHGLERQSPFIQVCWRGDLELDSSPNREASLDVLTQVAPRAAECLPVPLGVFRDWLAGSPVEDFSADLEGTGDEDDEEAKAKAPRSVVQGAPRLAVLWRGRDESVVITSNEDGAIFELDSGVPARRISLRPGDTIVVPTTAGGAGTLGDLPDEDIASSQLDRGDQAYRTSHNRALLRLHPRIVADWKESQARTELLRLLLEAAARFDSDSNSFRDDVLACLKQLPVESVPAWIRTNLSGLVTDRRADVQLHPVAGVILRGSPAVISGGDEGGEGFSDADDASASGTARVSLQAHLQGVAQYARHFAESCGLPATLIEAIGCAALLHDVGKADPRFQALLYGGNRWIEGELLAKSNQMPHGRRAFKSARDAARYPVGGRHELVSVRLAQSDRTLLPADEIQCDLVLHLIASHHGRCRPFAPVVRDEFAIEVRLPFEGRLLLHQGETLLEQLDSGVSDRYWRLVQHFGWWGLAWLETILRLADHRRSEAEEAD